MIHLLLVDDNPTIKSLIKLLLKEHKEIEIVGDCSDGSEIYPFIKNYHIDVILMDIMMKKMNGFEATKKVKAINPDIKIIGLSCSDHIHYIAELLEAGADDFLSKYELTETSLLKKIRSLF